MLVILFRHGIAEPAVESPEGDDASRRLTEEGRLKTAQAAAGLARWLREHDAVGPDGAGLRILSSPRARARGTAELLATTLKGEVEICRPLAGEDARTILRGVRKRLEGAETPRTLALVGHEPDLSETASVLLCGSPAAVIDLKKAGVIALRAHDDPARLEAECELVFAMPPKVLRWIAEATAD